MKRCHSILLAMIMLLPLSVIARTISESIKIEDTRSSRVNSKLHLYAEILLDELHLRGSHQIYITPVVSDGEGHSDVLPAVLVNGRAMHIAYERGSLDNIAAGEYDVYTEVKRNNGRPQTVDYHASVELQPWMWSPKASVSWTLDSCGCGYSRGVVALKDMPLNLNPAGRMRLAYMTPEVSPLPVDVHKGESQVQYEVGQAVLHTEPFVCRNGQRIDNRSQLEMIADSIATALSDENVEIAKLKICGYASPEGDYMANNRLSTERAKSLAQYLANRFNLSSEKSEFDAVAENWEGLRDLVATSDEISETQRRELIALIDKAAFDPDAYDAKDRELRTNPKFASLYSSLILPIWYPSLRVTKFEISTRLKPATDEQLAVVMSKSPEKMSLNQMFRVAKLYPEGSPEFNNVINTALKYYPDDITANLNAAVAALRDMNLQRAETLLEKAGNTPEALNAKGVLAVWRGDMEFARTLFNQALPLPEAAKNLEMLGN